MNCCNEPFTGQENQLAESVAHLYESEGAIAKGCCRGCWEFVNCFLFILYPVINIPARTSSAFLLGSLGWTLFSLTSSRRLSSFVHLPWSVYFLHSHSLSIFLWAVVLNYLIVAATLFRCLFHPPFFFLFFCLAQFLSALVCKSSSNPLLLKPQITVGRALFGQ